MNKTEALKFLGIDETADADAIKKAYKKAAAKYHPDVCKDSDASEKFKKAKDALDVLSKKRVDLEISRNIQFPPAQTTIELTFEEAVLGSKRRIEIETYVKCDACDGDGFFGYEGKCGTCNGRRVESRHVGGGMVFAMPCATCYGTGHDIERCNVCNGDCAKLVKRGVNIDLPGGISSGKEIRVKGAGHYSCGRFGKTTEPLFLRPVVRPHPIMVLDGMNVVSTIEIPLKDAIIGNSIEVETVHGKKTLSLPKRSKHRDRVLLKGCGAKAHDETGDHVFELNIVYPDNIEELISSN